jgi:hypothetical protein
MNLLRKARWMFLGLLLSLAPASSFAGVLISVGIAPPPLPIYEQPPCPEPGWMWTPGYWSYGPGGYYWVPGSWVPAPYVGALWTPPYWGWSGGLYVFHPGYWGRHVGYYGGINYGFGYMGVGFVGGMWHGHDFRYNTAVVRVNNVHVRNVYVDRTVVVHNTIVNDRRVSYNGGRDGVRYEPRPEERRAMNEHHMAETPVQIHHAQAASADRNFYAKNSGGHPQNVVAERPMDVHGNQGNARPQEPNYHNGNRGDYNSQGRPEYQNRQQPAHQAEMEQPHGSQQPAHRTEVQQPHAFQQPVQQMNPQQAHGSEQQHGNNAQPHGNHQQPRNESHSAPQAHGGGHGDHGGRSH